MTVKKAVTAKIIRLLEEKYQDASLALNFSNPLQLLVSTILAAQCTDKRVNDVTKELFKKYKKAEDFERVKTNVLEKGISSFSFYRNKASNIRECCKVIVEKYGNNVHSAVDELTSLPGIGRKTANIVLGNAFDQSTIAVDTHVLRVSTRLGLAVSKNPDKVEKELCEVIPRGKWTRICRLFQAHGRATCKAKNPSCQDCILFDICEWKDKRSK